MVIIAILALIAVPTYRSSMHKARRSEGKALLETIMAVEGRFYARTNHYTNDAGPDGLGVSIESLPGKYYVLSNIDVSDGGQTVTLTAAPQNVQVGDLCGSLVLDSAGKRGISVDGQDIASCW